MIFFLQNGNLYSLTKTLSEVQLGYWIVQLKLFPVCQVGFLFIFFIFFSVWVDCQRATATSEFTLLEKVLEVQFHISYKICAIGCCDTAPLGCRDVITVITITLTEWCDFKARSPFFGCHTFHTHITILKNTLYMLLSRKKMCSDLIKRCSCSWLWSPVKYLVFTGAALLQWTGVLVFNYFLITAFAVFSPPPSRPPPPSSSSWPPGSRASTSPATFSPLSRSLSPHSTLSGKTHSCQQQETLDSKGLECRFVFAANSLLSMNVVQCVLCRRLDMSNNQLTSISSDILANLTRFLFPSAHPFFSYSVW